jgi:putative phosphoesterase
MTPCYLILVRIALISDLHGNMVALDAVLERIQSERVDRVVCLGDVATLGPEPARVIETLAELGCSCILGNHDEFLLDAELIHTYTELPVIVAAVDACRASLGTAELDFVRTFQVTLDLDLDGATLSLFHGSPRSHMENLLATTSTEELDQALGNGRGTVMAGGHTHLQMLRQHRGTLLVNPGSLGLPFETFASGGPPRILPHAEYATVDTAGGAVGVTLHRVHLGRNALIAQTNGWDNPLRDYLLGQYEGHAR